MSNYDFKVIGLDMDGTLLKDDKTISEYTKNILLRAIEKGIHIVPATGRVCIGIPKFIRDMPGIRYGICSNGASVLDFLTGTELYSCRILSEDSLKILDILEKYNTLYDAYIDGQGYVDESFFEHIDDYRIEPHILKMYKNTRTPVKSLRRMMEEGQLEVEKFNLFFADASSRLKAFEELNQLSFVKVTSSLYNNIEINAADCNKGTALLGFAEKLGYSKEQVMGFGDGSNDYEMILMSGMGIAMANGLDMIKEAADYITFSNEDDGVAKAIEQFCLSKQ